MYVSRDAVTSAWTRLLQSEYGNEVRLISTDYKFPGRRQRETPCADVLGLQRILIFTGGKIGQAYCDLATMTLTRIAVGDTSLIDEIEDNAASDSPVAELAREALAVPLSIGGGGAGAPTDEGEGVREVRQPIAGIDAEGLNACLRAMPPRRSARISSLCSRRQPR